MKRLIRPFALIALAALSIGAGKPAPNVNWLGKVSARSNGAWLVGDPQAKVRLVEYVSYTCPHCAAFEMEGSGEIALGMIRTGKGSIEVRSYLRNDIDITATLLVNCGDVSKFPGNHAAVLRTQARWMKNFSPAQEQRWHAMGDYGMRMHAIASDMDLYPIFEARGYRRTDLDRCLANQALVRQIAQENRSAEEIGAVSGTPGFLINDRPQDAHDWASLRPALAALTR